MPTSFLEYLTLPNPNADSSRCKDGYSTKSMSGYGPDDVKPWTDLTLENLEMSYKNILLQPMDEPRIRSAREISPERTRLFEESSVQTLAEDWNEKVVQHVLNGTRSILHQELPDGPFNNGKIYFTKNRGQGHIKDGRGVRQKPDWCLYQKGGVADAECYRNLLPGDIKPAKKWKSIWIESSDQDEKKKADLVLAQITKYMSLGNTRYGFILSEEELVAMRLSRFIRDKEALEELAQDKSEFEKHLADSTMNLEKDPDGSFGGADQTDGILLEYCGIPWAASGIGSFTVNLTLWWLSVLAVQGAPIKQAGKYTPMHARIRGGSPAWVDPEDSRPIRKPRSIMPTTRPKRKAPDGSEAALITRKHSLRSNINNTATSSRTKPPKAHARSSMRNPITPEEQIDPGQSFTSNASSRASKRRRRAPVAYTADSSDGESSQATNDYNLSFSFN
ncbi:hypothetical protein GGS26DRAFT_65781 [Hypomontagnella submonticulosa]|nr:hypothetical protein GGS26DRAFT_65781 [Hypomontagnella submonticulosa]